VRWPAWLVRTAIFGGLGLLLIIAIGGRIRADRALDKANSVAEMGTPGMVAARAQQAASVWAGQPAVVISVEREQRHWRAVAMVGGACYELAVGDKVSAHPGLIPCPPVSAAGSADATVSGMDSRYGVVTGFLDAWLRGDPTADRYLADERPALAPPPEEATDVKVTGVYGGDKAEVPGARSVITATADVTFDERTESLAWTLLVVRGDTRWSVEQVAGGEIPTGDGTTLTQGRGDPASPA
jgi:hypothetical protein